MTTTEGQPARQRILDVVGDLFYREGFHAVGVDRIAEQAGVTKMTLYRHFPSKDLLIAAYLEAAGNQFMTWLESSIEAHSGDPYRQICALFEAVADLTTAPHCHGCVFQNTAAEFRDLDHAGHHEARAHKLAVLARLRNLAEGAGARDPDALADQLWLLLDGAWAAKRMFGPKNPARHIAAAAKALLDAQVPARRVQRRR